MQNETNSNTVCPELVEGLCKTNPIYALFSPKTMIAKKNEPNLVLSEVEANYEQISNEPNFPQINHSLIYPFTHLLIHSKFSNEPNFALSGYEQQFSNEPDLKNTKINVTSLSKKLCADFYPLQH